MNPTLGEVIADNWTAVGGWISACLAIAGNVLTIYRARVAAEAKVSASLTSTIDQLRSENRELIDRVLRVRGSARQKIAAMESVIRGLQKENADLAKVVATVRTDPPLDPPSLPPPALDEPTTATRREHSTRFQTVDPKDRRKR